MFCKLFLCTSRITDYISNLLQEEGLRSRVAYDTRSRGTSAKPSETELHQMPAKQQLAITNFHVALAIVVFLCGLYIGKLLWTLDLKLGLLH